MKAPKLSAGLPSASRARFGLVVVCLGSLLGPFDSAVNVAFPAITQIFGIALADIQWIIIAFVVAQSSLTLVFGKLGDLYGHRRIFQLGLACCAVAHLLCGWAPTYSALVAARVGQGVAVGLTMACAPALATLLFAPEEKRRILALYVMLIGIGAAFGPILGGALVAWLGWPGVFWFRVPLALLALVLSIGLPEPELDRPLRPKLDGLGAALLVLSLTALTGLMNALRHPDANVAIVLALLAGWLLATWGFIRHERAFPEPILNLAHFRNRTFAWVQFAAVAIHFATFSILLLLPYRLAELADATPTMLGATLALFPVGSVIGGMIGGWLAPSNAIRGFIQAGLIVTAAGLLLTAYILIGTDIGTIGFGLVVSGVGLGLFQLGYMELTTSILPPAERGVAGSLVNVTRLVGYVIGAATITWLYETLHAVGANPEAFAQSFAVLGAALLLLAGFVWRIARGPTPR